MKRAVFLLLVCAVFCGCAKEEKTPVYRVVTGVQVEYRQGDNFISRHYTRTESVQAVLNYLRILKPHGPVIPENGNGNGCRITLHFSQGPDTVYLQQGTAYLSRQTGQWETIDSARATLLYPILLLLPSDE